jgi:hypothetical protein
VSKEGATWQAEIEMRDAGGGSLGSRKVAGDGPQCTSLAAAAGLAIALMIDPDAMLEPRPVPPPADVVRKDAPARPPAPIEPISARRGALTVAMIATARVLPRTAPGVQLEGDLRLADRLDIAISTTFLPEKRQSREGNDVSFGLFWGSVGPCYRMLDASRVSLSGCTALLVGALRTAVFDPIRARTSALPWAAASAGLRAAWAPIPAFEVEGGVELLTPFYRRDYLVERAPGDNVVVFSDPAVAGAGFVGVGVQY